jgi:hypothetical protein
MKKDNKLLGALAGIGVVMSGTVGLITIIGLVGAGIAHAWKDEARKTEKMVDKVWKDITSDKKRMRKIKREADEIKKKVVEEEGLDWPMYKEQEEVERLYQDLYGKQPKK